MTDGSYGYIYDEAGNLIEKGNRYNIEGDTVTFLKTEGSSVEYWEYEYNLQNRLSRVRKNGEVIAEFLYDVDGMRVKAEEKLEEIQESRTTYFIYSYSGSVLMEESASNSSDDSSETKYTSYIYAFAKTFAKVDGILDPVHITAEKIAYFHHDNLGSTRLMTDSTGNVVMDQDYMPFGGDLPEVGQTEVLDEEAEGYKYTGQKEVASIGLYYYGARYYDPKIGRFITEDSWPGEMVNPQSQNLYVYVMNNPLRYVDPTGNVPKDSKERQKIIEELKNQMPESIMLEYGCYEGLEYILIQISLNNTNISFKVEHSTLLKKVKDFHDDEDIININLNYFGGNPLKIIGDIYQEGEYIYGYTPPSARDYFGQLEDGLFEFGKMEGVHVFLDETNWIEGYGLPSDRDKFKLAVSGVGQMIRDGEVVSRDILTEAFGKKAWSDSLRSARRPAFGVDKLQENAFIFVGFDSRWEISDMAKFMQGKGVYNAMFADGGSSTALTIKGIPIIESRDGVLSVFKVIQK